MDNRRQTVDSPPPARGRRRKHPPGRLGHHLAVTVAAKVAILAALWFAFFHHPAQGLARPRSAADATAAHVLGTDAPQGVSP